MWSMYANNYKGYCIECDISEYLNKNIDFAKNLFKVKYVNERSNNFVSLLLTNILAELFKNMNLKYEHGTKQLQNEIIESLITKYKEWSFRKEWRIIGMPGDKSIKLPIKAVYSYGKLSEEEATKIIDVCDRKHISVYRQRNVYFSLKIYFDKII